MAHSQAHQRRFALPRTSDAWPPRRPISEHHHGSGVAQDGHDENFFKKGVKKLNSKKGCRFGKFPKKIGTSRPINGREAWGRTHPAHPTDGRCQIFFQAPLEGLFVNKKLFLFAKRPLPRRQRHPARPTCGRCPTVRISYFLFEFIFYKLFKIHTFLNTRFIRHTLLYTYKILVQFYEEDYGI
jgi:hypothetical protein